MRDLTAKERRALARLTGTLTELRSSVTLARAAFGGEFHLTIPWVLQMLEGVSFTSQALIEGALGPVSEDEIRIMIRQQILTQDDKREAGGDA